MIRKTLILTLVALMLASFVAPAVANDFAFVGKVRGHERFGIVLCDTPAGRPAVVVFNRLGQPVCGPVALQRVPGEPAFTFECGDARFVVRRNGTFKIIHRGRCIQGVLCPVP